MNASGNGHRVGDPAPTTTPADPDVAGALGRFGRRLYSLAVTFVGVLLLMGALDVRGASDAPLWFNAAVVAVALRATLTGVLGIPIRFRVTEEVKK